MLAIILISVALDLIVGDPRFFYHPVLVIGKFARFLEEILYKYTNKQVLGVIFNLIIVGLVTGFVYLAVYLSFLASPILGVISQVLFISVALAVNSLAKEGFAVVRLLKNGDVNGARLRVSTIVSRDMSSEGNRGIIRAVIESMTENLSDAVVAPLFFAVIGGAPGIWFYKSVNTLDSMVGYKDDHYGEFGWFSARFDDVVNYIPARITGVLILVAGFLTGGSVVGGVRAWFFDAQKGPSPNGGIPIVVFAGVRGIALGGDCFSKCGRKTTIPLVGGSRVELVKKDVNNALIVHFLVTFLFLTVVFALSLVF